MVPGFNDYIFSSICTFIAIVQAIIVGGVAQRYGSAVDCRCICRKLAVTQLSDDQGSLYTYESE